MSPVLDVLIFIFYFVYLFNSGLVAYPLGVSWNELKTKRLQVFRVVRLSSIIIDSHRFEAKYYLHLNVCHPRCVRSLIQSCSMYISIYIYTDGHENNNITISSNIYKMRLHVSALYLGHHQVVQRTY